MSPKPPSTRRMIKEFLRPWWRSPLATLGATVLILAAGRIALDPLLTARVRSQLDLLSKTGVAVAFRDLQVSLFPPSLALTELTFHGQSGESLDVDRVEFRANSLRDLTAAIPHVRLHIVRPYWRTFPGALDLDHLARAMPAAYVDEVSFTNGSIGNAAGGDGRAVLSGLKGTIEGLGTGAQPGGQGWRMLADGYLADLNPVHVAIDRMPAKWEAAFTVRGLAWAASAEGLPFSIVARVDGADSRFKAVVQVNGLAHLSPIARTHDTLGGLSDKWPSTNLILTEAHETSANAGAGLDLVMVEDHDKSLVHGFRPQDGIGVVVNVAGLAGRVLVVPATVTAMVESDDPAVPQPGLAVNLGGDHEGD